MPLGEVTATSLLMGFPEPMLVMKPSGALVFANPAAGVLLELDQSAVEGRNIIEFLPEQERSRLDPLAWMQRWAETPDAPEIEYVHLVCRTVSGSERAVRVRVGRLQLASETLYVVMLQDISGDQARQHEQRQAHRLAARVLAISADAIVTVDQALCVNYANPSAERLFGYGSGALTGLPLDTLLPGRFRPGHGDHIARFAAESSPARLMGDRSEIIGLTRNGTEIPLEASITKVTLDRQLVFSAHLRDLRPRKAAERKLAETLASFRLVFDHALQAMALIDPSGKVLQMNTAALRLMPAGQEPIGQDFAGLPFWSEDSEATRALLNGAIETCLTGETFRIAANIRFPDGAAGQLDFSLTPVIEDGATFALIAEARNVPAA